MKPLPPHLLTASVVISQTQKRKLIEINTTKAMQTSKRIRGRTQEKRLQEFNLFTCATLDKGYKRRVTIYKLRRAVREGLGSPDPAVGE